MKSMNPFAAGSVSSHKGQGAGLPAGGSMVNVSIEGAHRPCKKLHQSGIRYVPAVFLMIMLMSVSAGKLTGQTTFTWDGGAGDNLWTSAANWNPDRTAPAASDIILFNSGTALTILNVPNLSYTPVVTNISRLSVTNNTSVTLKPGTELDRDGEIIVNAPDANALYVQAGSTLTITGRDITGTTNDNILLFSLANVAGAGATIEGTLRNALDNGQLEAHGYYDRKGTTQLFSFKAGSSYEQAINGGYIPYGTWEAGSTCLVTGTVNNRPRFRETDVYADIVWNCPLQTGVADFQGYLRTVGGDFTVISTGSSFISIGAQVSTDITISGDYIQQGGGLAMAPTDPYFNNLSRKMTVMGNFTLSAGTFRICPSVHAGILEVNGKFTSAGDFFFHQSGNNASAAINANGDCEISGGTFTMSSANSSLGAMNLKGNFSHTGGIITETGLAGDIVFSGTEVQTFTSTGGSVTNMINFSVNSGAFLQMAAESTVMTSGAGGTFTLNTGSTLGIKSPSGIETSGSAGNIQTQERYFNVGANYVYNGSSAQTTGSGLTQNIPAGLEINNSAGVRLSAATEISGLLKMTSGTLDLANTSFEAGSLTGSSNITNSTGTPAAVTITIGSDDTDAPSYGGVISNGTASSVALTKTGNGTLVLSGTNTYTGPTTISGGSLELGSAPATAINDNSEIVLAGGTLSTGYADGLIETLGILSLSASSTISLGSGSHILQFADSHEESWQTGATLNITGWSGSPGTPGTAGRIFVGSDDGGLIPTQLSAINFYGYSSGATILSSGEIAPFTESAITISSPNPAAPAANIPQTSANNVIYRLDLSVTQGNAVITSLQATLSGTFLSSDISALKVWYSSDDTFSTSDALLSTITSTGPGLHLFTPWTNQEILSGNTGHVFITADLPCGAVTGNFFSVNAISTSDFTVISGTKTGTANPGGLQSIVHAIPLNPSGPSATLGNSQSELSWNNPDCFDGILIVAKEGSPVTSQPSGDGTSYNASQTFGSGTEFDGGYVVYKGSLSPVTVTGLTNGTVYHFTFFSRRGSNWSSGITVSVTPAANTGLSFRSAGSGNWSSAAVWEMSYDNGSSWLPALVSPNSTYGPVTVAGGHTLSVTSNLSIDETIIETGATVTTSAVLTIADGPAADCSVSGTVETTGSGSIISTGSLEFADGGTYIHNRNGGSVPAATWSAASNCNITGITSTSLVVSSLLQSFGNFTWNCPGQTVNIQMSGNLRDIKGNYTVTNTNGPNFYIRMGGGTPVTLTVGGNYTQTGGVISLLDPASFTMIVAGDFSLTGSGRINMNRAGATGTGTIMIAGDFTHTGTDLTELLAGGDRVGSVIFNGSGSQQLCTFDRLLTSVINFTVNPGAYLQMAGPNTAITGRGTFTLSPGATLGITSAGGITTTGTNSGNILTTAGRVYDDEANYIYNGTGSQVSGDGLPETVNSLGVAGTSDLTLTNGPSKSSPLIISDDLTISSDGGLAVGPAQAVTVDGNVVNDGDLDLEADGTGMASLLIKGSYSGAGNVKSEIFMTGGDAGTDMWRWHYFAVPSLQSSESLAEVYGDDIMNYIDADMNDKSEGWNWYDGYDGTTGFANLIPGNGYAYYNDNDRTMVLNGNSLLTSLGTVNLNYAKYGWNLIGNSLTCGLNWDLVTFTGQVDHSVSFIKDYVEYYYIQNGPGVPDGTTGNIPPLQGFFVQALEKGTSINFSGAKEHNAVAYYKGAGSKNDKGNEFPIIRLSLAKGESRDEMVVWFMEEATMGYDYKFDAEKWYSEGTRPQIYSVLTGREYAINGIPLPETTAEIPLGLWIPEAGSYTISLMELDNIGDYDIYMKDLVNNTKTKLDDSYRFTFTAPAGAVKGRFVIAMENRTTGTEEWKISENPFRVYGSFGFINIELQDEAWEGKQGSVRVVDLSGRTLIDSRDEIFSMTSLLRLPMESRKGIYIVEINSFPQRYVTRVVMK